ncbi:hypothetical protein H5410_030848 [Solanum commersonii]|uniref:Uncharacterized protein n=1 Tax=Solanum commersonii TaxID=4109 RepID=A0A9J5YKJ9_SOLCO|nr:hypothetical protein H5410_030848 [Solanum commersonii]
MCLLIPLEIRLELLMLLQNLENAMFESARKASLRDTSMLGSSEANDAKTPGTDAQTEGVLIAEISGTNSPTDKVTAMQTSPQA